MFKKIIKWVGVPFFLILFGMLLVPFIDYLAKSYIAQQQIEPIPVSLVQLIANPTAFNGKEIITEGYLKPKDKMDLYNVLYLDRDSAVHNMSYNSINVAFGKNKHKDVNLYEDNFIFVRGVFYIDKYHATRSVTYKTLEQLKDEMILVVSYYDFCLSDPEIDPDRSLCGPRYIVIEDPSQK